MDEPSREPRYSQFAKLMETLVPFWVQLPLTVLWASTMVTLPSLQNVKETLPNPFRFSVPAQVPETVCCADADEALLSQTATIKSRPPRRQDCCRIRHLIQRVQVNGRRQSIQGS